MNDFAEISENLTKYRSKYNFVGLQNNCAGSMMSNAAKSFDILATSLSILIIILHNYFNSPTKLFLDLHLTFYILE